MKKLKIWSMMMFIAMALPMMVACGDDGGGSDSSANALKKQAIGKWMCITSYDIQNGKIMTDLMVGKEVTIMSNNTYTSTSSSFGYSGTYTISGNTITAKSSKGATFVVDVTFRDDKMYWEGKASNGVTFGYMFVKESDDTDDTDVKPAPSIYWRWKCTSSTNEGNRMEGLLVGDYLTFDIDNTYTSTSPSLGESGTYTWKGITIKLQSSNGVNKEFTIASIDQSKLKLTDNLGSGRSYTYVLERK